MCVTSLRGEFLQAEVNRVALLSSSLSLCAIKAVDLISSRVDEIAPVGFMVLLVCLFALLVCLCCLLVLLMAHLELFANFLRSCVVTLLDPWVSNNIGNREALVWVEAKHSGNEVLEFLVEEILLFTAGVGCPELARFVGGDQLVVRVLHIGHIKRWVPSIHDEQNNAKGEKVDNLSLVRLASMDFGGHESKRADDTAVDSGAVTTLNWTSEAKVDNLDIIVLIEQYVLAFEITMRETTGVDIVDSLDELLGIVSGNALTEGPRVRDEVE